MTFLGEFLSLSCNKCILSLSHFLLIITDISLYICIYYISAGFEPNTTVAVMPEDFIGPLPSFATETTDYMLLVSWLFVIFCSGFMFVQSNLGQQWINRVKILWQEHQHID